MNSLIASLRGSLIVSCQADPGSPFRDPHIIGAFAKAAEKSGAKAVRIQSFEDIQTVRHAIQLPIIGLTKRIVKDFDVYITPSPDEAKSLITAGANIVAFDATRRSRPHSVLELTQAVHAAGAIAMADCATIQDIQDALDAGADLIGTTMSGYTPDSPRPAADPFTGVMGIDWKLIQDAVALGACVIAEGRISSPADAQHALELGAHAVVVGTVITRPDVVMGWYVNALKSVKK